MIYPKLTLMDMMRQLIAAPSMSSVSPQFDISNRAVIDLLADWLETLGWVVEVMPLPCQPHKANLLARLGPLHEHSQGLVLAGHTDTVPYDAHRWHHDPFRLTEADGRLYGLGTSDMKSFFALAIEAARHFEKNALKQPLFIMATADEESSMDGARQMVLRGCPHARYAVIGEPTGMRPVNAHKGIMMESIRIIGRSGHSSDPSLGVNAMEAMQLVMAELLRWRGELQRQYRDERFTVPVPTLNLGHIHGGDNPNRICGECVLHFDLRPLPGMSVDTLRMELLGRLERVLGSSGVIWELSPLFHGTPPLHTDEHSLIARECEGLTHHRCHAVAFCTEAPYLTDMGIDTIILGPGDIDQAHQPDEFLALDRLHPTVDLLANLIRRFCC